MKVFFLGAPSTFNDQVQRALDRSGTAVIAYNERSAMLVPRLWRHAPWAWALTRRLSPVKKWNNRLFNRALLNAVREAKPDVFLTTKGTTIRPDTLKAMRNEGVLTVNWCLENVYHPTYQTWFRETAGAYGHFLSFDPTVAQRFSFPGTQMGYLPFAVDADAYAAMPSEADKKRFGCDVCFVGALYPEREQLLKAVVGLGVDLKIFGWKQWKNSSLGKYYHGPLGTREMVAAFQCAKICLNSNLLPKNGGANNRTFEIPAAGGFELCDRQEDIPNLFKLGEEIETYVDPQDAVRKIGYFLNHNETRLAVARAGHERVVKSHSFDERIRNLLSTIQP